MDRQLLRRRLVPSPSLLVSAALASLVVGPDPCLELLELLSLCIALGVKFAQRCQRACRERPGIEFLVSSAQASSSYVERFMLSCLRYHVQQVVLDKDVWFLLYNLSHCSHSDFLIVVVGRIPFNNNNQIGIDSLQWLFRIVSHVLNWYICPIKPVVSLSLMYGILYSSRFVIHYCPIRIKST